MPACLQVVDRPSQFEPASARLLLFVISDVHFILPILSSSLSRSQPSSILQSISASLPLLGTCLDCPQFSLHHSSRPPLLHSSASFPVRPALISSSLHIHLLPSLILPHPFPLTHSLTVAFLPSSHRLLKNLMQNLSAHSTGGLPTLMRAIIHEAGHLELVGMRDEPLKDLCGWRRVSQEAVEDHERLEYNLLEMRERRKRCAG
jgi:hypothetical protein